MNDRALAHLAKLRTAPIWIGLAAVVALSWLYLFRMSAAMPGMTSAISDTTSQMSVPMTAPTPHPRLTELLFTFVMWGVMMTAMMVPTTVPAIALFAQLSDRRRPLHNPTWVTAIYMSGYIAVWLGFSCLAAIAQMVLTQTLLISPMTGSSNVTVSSLILLGAGTYQFTPLKDVCLTQCRSPLAFFMAEWRDGGLGAFVLGLRQGAYCVTCCWMLMAVMFAVGVMNVVAMGLLTVFLLIEKLAPPGWHISRLSGAALIAWAAWIGAGAWL